MKNKVSHSSQSETLLTENFISHRIKLDLESNLYSGVLTRFPPEPNGFLHLGHAKSICLNFGISKFFNGACNLRFDDTNPATEEDRYVKAIQEDILWLGFEWATLRFASDYFEEIYAAAENLIQQGLAYVDESSPEDIKASRGNLKEAGKASIYRSRSEKENLIAFRRMRSGKYEEGKAVLRAKIDLSSPFFVLRDPVLYRIKFLTHHRTSNKWCIYPMYDFAHCISDAIEGISHSICTLEFQDNRRLYDWVLNNLRPYPFKTRPFQHEFARLNLEGLVLSKRHLNKVVQDGLVDGWDDPRMPTLAGIRRKGVPAAAIRLFCQKLGISKEGGEVPRYVFEDVIRDYLNLNSPRSMAVLDPIELIIENWPSDKDLLLSVQNHPKDMSFGTRNLAFSKTLYISRADVKEIETSGYKRLSPGGNLVRLRGAYVIQATRVEKDASGAIYKVYVKQFPDSLGMDSVAGKAKGVIHWINKKNAIPAEFRLYSDSFLKTKKDELQQVDWEWNQNSLRIVKGLVEENLLKDLSRPYQFEREGYFSYDSKLSEFQKMPVFHQIVALRTS